MPHQPLITVIGSLNMDLVTYASRIPSPGETLLAQSFALSPGGKGANQAVACSRLSRKKPDPASDHQEDSSHAQSAGRDDGRGEVHVKMVGAVGDDEFGASLTTGLRRDGIDVSAVETRQNVSTGVACVLVETDTGQNRILVSSNANDTLKPDQFKELSDPLPDLIILQLEIPLETVLQVLQTARHAGINVLLNPAPAALLPDDAYKAITHLIVNETEAATLAGVSAEMLSSEEALLDVAETFLDRGVRYVVITLGHRGAFYASREKENFRHGMVKAEQVSVVDTTAAGDTFVGAYAVRYVQASAETFDIHQAMRWANIAAARTVQRSGAQSAIPWRNELTA
ncbi:MAG: hypothetical protein M1816_002443 [Peltula sp. TS41687]|nr:MAG: hypothetical protein M1816_002443 [Peltula sp. TS41687]